MSEDVLDLGPGLGPNLERARAREKRLLWVTVSAENCPGCEILEEQLASRAVRASLGSDVYLMRVVAGDLYENPPRKARIGSWVLESVGFPTTWVFELVPGALSFQALALGPLPQDRAAAAAREMCEGTSVWVAEAEGVHLRACSDLLCIDLDAGNGFRVPFTVPFP